MTPEDFVAAVRRQQGGLLLDANLLLLLLIERTEPNRYRAFARTRQFKAEHIAYLALALENATRLVTTPHILTEVSNLSDRLVGPLRTKFFEALREFIEEARERAPRATNIAGDEAFAVLGIADVGPMVLSSRARPLLLTVDALLALTLESRGLPVVNLNHCISGWSAAGQAPSSM